MQIFTSWSGERSKAAALGLRSLLQDLFEDAVDVFISEHINPGEAWAVRLGRELEESEFGIICIAQENARAPWLLFEAGAIAKKFGTSLVSRNAVQITRCAGRQMLLSGHGTIGT